MDEDETFAPFWTHIEELRRTLLHMILIIVSGMFICVLCYAPLISVLTAPFTQSIVPKDQQIRSERIEQWRLSNDSLEPANVTLPEGASPPIFLPEGVSQITIGTYSLPPNSGLIFSKPLNPTSSLVVLGPLEGLLIALKTSLWTGTVLTSPLWLFLLLQFVAPAMRNEEKRLVVPFLLFSITFIIIGGSFAYFITIPLANTYLIAFNQLIGTNLWSLTHYLDYTVFLLLANGLAFELCVIGLFAVHLGLVSAAGLIAKRRIAIVGALILGALLTPPDVLTQMLLAIPLIVLYECIIIYARLRTPMKSSSVNQTRNV